MASFDGRWELVSSDNFMGYLQAVGVSADNQQKMKGMEVTGPSGGKEEFEVKGDSITRRTITKDNAVHSEATVKLGEQSSGKSIDGRDIQVTLSMSGNKLVREETGDGYSSRVERVVDGDNMTVTMTAGGVTCVRKMQKVQ